MTHTQLTQSFITKHSDKSPDFFNPIPVILQYHSVFEDNWDDKDDLKAHLFILEQLTSHIKELIEIV